MSFFDLGYRFLAGTPLWILMPVLSFLCIGILFPIRNFYEGIEYNHAWSSELGDIFLVALILDGATVIHRLGITSIPADVSSGLVTILLILWCVGIAFEWGLTFVIRKEITAADAYHNIFVVALVAYLVGAVVPIILYHGTSGEKGGFILLLLWLVTFIFDLITGRAQQNKYQARKGMRWNAR